MAEACDFRQTYERVGLPVMRELERRFLGSDYGGTSWTTRSQAEEIVGFLELGAGVQLLDVGAGAGWPALFLARATGCGVTLADLPVNALQLAMQRAKEDGVSQRTQILAASGAALPFADNAFDAVAHADVLCCMPEKETMLRECRRVVHEGGRMLFSVISVPPSVPEAEYREAVEAGPPFIEAPDDYPVLIRDAGWRVMEHIDATEEYGISLQALLAGVTEMADALIESIGFDEYDAMRQRRTLQFDAHGRGLLRREIFVAKNCLK